MKLEAQIVSARDWLGKVKESQDGPIVLKELERLVRSGKQLPVKFGEPYEQSFKRLNMALDL